MPREFHAPPIAGKPVGVIPDVARVGCSRCGTVRQVEVPFADSRCHRTKSFERYALERLKQMTIRDVARRPNVGWDTIEDIRKRHLQKHFGKPRLKGLHRIASGEISIGRGHRYPTVVLDPVGGAVVFVGDGKGADSLEPFRKRLESSRAKVGAVATDMSPAYIRAVQENLASGVQAFDRFHVVEPFNERFSNFRRELQRDAGGTGRKFLKGTRRLLLKNPENRDEKKGERRRLEEALKANAPLRRPPTS